jgi:oligosaccharide repeat unit polymerase
MKSPNLYKSLILLSWFVSLFLFLNSPLGINDGFILSILLNVIISSIFFLLYQKHIHKKFVFISISFLFLVSIYITHFQIGLIHILGFKIENIAFENFIWGDTSKGNLSIAISSLAVVSFFVGHIFNEKKIKRNIIGKYQIKKYEHLINFLTFSSILFYILFFINSGSYKLGNYASGDQEDIANYFLTLFRILIKAALILKMYSLSLIINNKLSIREYIAFIGKPLTAIVLWHILFSIYVGDRAPILVFSILYFGVFFLYNTSKRFKVILISSFIIIPILFSFLGSSRSRVGENSFISNTNSTSYESRYSGNFSQVESANPGLSTLELALSVRCFNHALSNVPSKYDYKYGSYQFKQILASIPFLSGVVEAFKDGNKEEASSADFITFLIQGRNSTYGDATTPIADLYLDFGVFGVVIGFFIFGRWAKKADLIIILRHPTSLINWIAIMFFWSGSIYLGRATFLYYLQTIVQIYIIVTFLNLFIKNKYITNFR